jgi:hypothetical protein
MQTPTLIYYRVYITTEMHVEKSDKEAKAGRAFDGDQCGLPSRILDAVTLLRLFRI